MPEGMLTLPFKRAGSLRAEFCLLAERLNLLSNRRLPCSTQPLLWVNVEQIFTSYWLEALPHWRSWVPTSLPNNPEGWVCASEHGRTQHENKQASKQVHLTAKFVWGLKCWGLENVLALESLSPHEGTRRQRETYFKSACLDSSSGRVGRD